MKYTCEVFVGEGPNTDYCPNYAAPCKSCGADDTGRCEHHPAKCTYCDYEGCEACCDQHEETCEVKKQAMERRSSESFLRFVQDMLAPYGGF